MWGIAGMVVSADPPSPSASLGRRCDERAMLGMRGFVEATRAGI